MGSIAEWTVPLALGLPLASAVAQAPQVGAPAPAISCSAWLNWSGEAPSLASLQGRVVLLEFWGTWCGPCVRAMPGIQKLHDRYSSRGLTVLAISYETPAVMEPFLTKNAYSMPVGSDPEKKTVAAYAVKSWPTTVVLDKEGKLAHIGSPYDAEAVVERLLGLEAGPAALLSAWFASLQQPKATQRESLQRLFEKAPPDFDLQAWAQGLVPAESVADGDSEAAKPVANQAGAAKKIDAGELLRKCMAAWNSPTTRLPLLQQLAAHGPTQFDLANFVQQQYAKSFPLDAGELTSLLKEKKYSDALDAIAQRAPAAAVVASAAKDDGFLGYCKAKQGDARLMAKKGLMAEQWVFANALPRDEKKNADFFGELSISGVATSADRKQIVGVMLGGEMLKKEQAGSYVQQNLARSVLMVDLAAGKPPRLRELAKLVAAEREAMLRDLEGRYGKPEPVK